MHPEEKLNLVCKFPECDCKVPSYAYSAHVRALGYCDKMKQAEAITNPFYGGKITCHKCGGYGYRDTSPLKEFTDGVFFHVDCFNKYEHYYGLDKPID